MAKQKSLDYYKKGLEELKEAFDDIIWMAIRYAHGRYTFSPYTVRKACEIRAKYGDFHIKEDSTLKEPKAYPPYRSGPLEKLPDNELRCKEDDLRDLMEKYK